MNSPERVCEACGARAPFRGVENAHIVPAAGSKKGCRCPANMIDLCWACHRMLVHGLGGWARLIEKFRHLRIRYIAAIDHYHSRCRGEGCGANTKSGQMALMRQRRMA